MPLKAVTVNLAHVSDEGDWAIEVSKSERKMRSRKKFIGYDLAPLTLEVAKSLDKGDVLKYIGPVKDQSYGLYQHYRRRNFVLQEKPQVGSKSIGVKIYNTTYRCPMSYLALAERGDPYGRDLSQAKRLIPVNLKGFKRNLANLIERTKENIDEYLETLPLHKKLELFKGMTPEEKLIYECLYKDIELLVGLKEAEEKSPDS